jgi:hypothetical protein
MPALGSIQKRQNRAGINQVVAICGVPEDAAERQVARFPPDKDYAPQ